MISSIFISIHILLLISLSINIIRIRMKHKVVLLDGDISELQYAIRAQANLLEYSPMFLLLMICAELNQASNPVLIGIASIFTVARLLHAYNFIFIETFFPEKLKLRPIAMGLTFFSLLALVIANFWAMLIS